MRSSMLDDNHESVEHGKREVGSGGRRLHASAHLRHDQGERAEPPLDGSVYKEFLREAVERGRAVLVDAVLVCHRIHQDDGLQRMNSNILLLLEHGEWAG